MKYLYVSPVFAVALLFAVIAPAYAITPAQLSHMSAAQKQRSQQYFNANSFDFSSIFKRYHPGPYWILKERNALHLSSVQVTQEERLKDKMAMKTIADSQALQQAYRRYARDAAVAHPAQAALKTDVALVGRAQTRLAWEMIPYHFQGYALLDAAQKAMYARLAAQAWAKHLHD